MNVTYIPDGTMVAAAVGAIEEIWFDFWFDFSAAGTMLGTTGGYTLSTSASTTDEIKT